MNKRKLKLTKTKDAIKTEKNPPPGYILNKGVPAASSVDQLVV